METSIVPREWLNCKYVEKLSEFQYRWFSAVKALELGFGGISQIRNATGLSRATIACSKKEIALGRTLEGVKFPLLLTAALRLM